MIKAKNIEVFSKLEIKQNLSTDNSRFLISNEKLTINPNKNSEVNLDLLLFIDDNYSKLADYGNRFCVGNTFMTYDLPHAMAAAWIMENITDEWSVSPYSDSFYSSKDIDWGYKPEGSLQIQRGVIPSCA
ncbi:TPA: hypothetical protein TUW56_000869 [Streptococcus equi subsp. zooepidemicus]|nr:hypothetical protein [Streptococcus equi subsp. zooepidemicus]